MNARFRLEAGIQLGKNLFVKKEYFLTVYRPLPTGSGRLQYCAYFRRMLSSTGLWSEKRKPSSCVCTFVSSTFGERIKPSMT